MCELYIGKDCYLHVHNYRLSLFKVTSFGDVCVMIGSEILLLYFRDCVNTVQANTCMLCVCVRGGILKFNIIKHMSIPLCMLYKKINSTWQSAITY